MNTADQYYSAYKSASNSLNRLSRILEKGDIEGAVQQIINDRELYGALSVVIPKDNIDSYIGSISEYYQLYADVTTALTDALESIPDEEINKFVNEAIKYAYDVDNGKSYLTTLIAGVDTQYIQDYVEYIDQNETVLKSMIHPVYYDDFMAYVDSLDVLKQYLVDNIKSADVSAVKEGADIINEVNMIDE